MVGKVVAMESKADWDRVAEVATGSLSAAAVVQSLLADDVGLSVPPWPNQKENDLAHA